MLITDCYKIGEKKLPASLLEDWENTYDGVSCVFRSNDGMEGSTRTLREPANAAIQLGLTKYDGDPHSVDPPGSTKEDGRHNLNSSHRPSVQYKIQERQLSTLQQLAKNSTC